jgi:uncharacterized protein YutE (UPF0331/DUF86 family)
MCARSFTDVLRPGDLERFENMASFRNLLVHYYERVDDEVVYAIFKKDLPDFEFFVRRIVEYLTVHCSFHP